MIYKYLIYSIEPGNWEEVLVSHMFPSDVFRISDRLIVQKFTIEPDNSLSDIESFFESTLLKDKKTAIEIEISDEGTLSWGYSNGIFSVKSVILCSNELELIKCLMK